MPYRYKKTAYELVRKAAYSLGDVEIYFIDEEKKLKTLRSPILGL